MPSIKYKKKTYAGSTFPVLEMTKAEYDALSEAKKMDGTVYMITDDTGGWEAENSVYDNTESGLTATNVQDALDEVDAAVDKLSKVTEVPLTINTQGATGSGRIVVCGRIATITASIRPTTTGTLLTLGWISDAGNPSGLYEWCKPTYDWWLSCNYYHSSETQEAEARILATGYVSVSTPIADRDLKISGTWITKGTP